MDSSDDLDQALQPTYAGDQSFLKADRTDVDDLPPAVDVAVVAAPFDGAVSRQPGTRYGPQAIRRASAWYAGFHPADPTPMYEADTGRVVDMSALSIRDCGDVTVYPTDVERTGERVRAAVRRLAETALPVLLGGDHYLTYPSFTGFAEAVDGDVGLLHLDSHADTYGPDDLLGAHNHGTSMNLIDESPHGGYENHAMVGLRGRQPVDIPELEAERGLHVSTARDVHDRGIDACMADAIDHAADGVDHVYLTIDIDVVDPAVAPGTGTPEQGGLSSVDLLRAVEQAATCERIGALDLVEVAPRLDPTRNTPRLAAAAITRFLEERFC